MISKSSEYAIRALVFVQLINWQNKRPLVAEIAKEIDAPEAYCAKILQKLTKSNLLDSMKGRGGGFFFNENQSNLPLYNVINLMDGDSNFHSCGFGLTKCNDDNPCPLHEKYKVIRDGYYEIVKSETIKSLTEKVFDGSAVLNRII